MVWPLDAFQRAVVVTTPVCRSIDWRQPVVPALDAENCSPPSENVSVDQVGMFARCCTSPGGWA